MTEFVVIRHGETDWNREQRFQGQSDPPLNATGLAQADRLARRLAAERADVLVSSDLLRARQTAEALARTWDASPLLRPGLREQAFGRLEGLQVPAIQAQFPQLWSLWLEHRADFALPDGGESLLAFQARVLADIRDLAARHAGARVAVVTHGGVLDMLWRAAHRLPLNGLRQCAIPNTGINRLRWVDGLLQVTGWADAAHLAEEPPA
jgi:probable phosphoglycerate mutase